jgi:hypothetical protein
MAYRSSNIVLFFLLIFSFTLQAQQKLTGTVVEKDTGAPVAFATIQAKNAKSTLTNGNGEFEIVVAELPARLSISHLNYGDVVTEVSNAAVPLKISLEPKVLTLKEVQVGNPAIAIMQDVSDKAAKNDKKSNYGKAFLRQIAYDDGKPVYLNEIFLDAEWKPYGLIAWHPTQARHLESSRGLSYTNFSYYSFVLSGYLPNTVHKKPLLGRVDSLYTFKLAGTYDQDGQEIAKIICTPKPVLKKGQRFEGTYYVNTVTNDVLKIEGSIRGVTFSGGGPVNIKNLETVFIAQYRINKAGDNVLDYSLLNSTNRMKVLGFGVKDTDLYSTLYMVDEEIKDKSQLKEVSPKIDDTSLVKAITYDGEFWKKNQGIKRTEKEQRAIEILEKIPQVNK